MVEADLRGFNTEMVKYYAHMFAECTSLEKLNLSGFNTKNATCTANMFESCSSLESLDLSSFDMRNCTNAGNMFNAASSLTSINIPLNVKSDVEIQLPGTFKDASGNEFTILPTQQTDGFVIERE